MWKVASGIMRKDLMGEIKFDQSLIRNQPGKCQNIKYTVGIVIDEINFEGGYGFVITPYNKDK